MTPNEVKQVFMDALPPKWTFPESDSLLDEWLSLFSPGLLATANAGWITRMTATVANLAAALSDYTSKQVDDSSFRLAAMLVAHCCHDDPPVRGRVCSNVTLGEYEKKGKDVFDGIKGRFNTRFKDSGLPPIP